MFDWLKKKPRKGSAASASAARCPGNGNSAPRVADRAEKRTFGGTGNVDAPENLTGGLSKDEKAVLKRVQARIEHGDFELPQLPSTSLAVIEMAAKPTVEIESVVKKISTDPMLAGELLKVANSALYAGRVPADTLHQAIMRVGVKTLRSMIFSVSLRGAMLRSDNLSTLAQETWRQAQSVGALARKIGPLVGIDAERAFLIGLLHDVGKVVLLSMLSEEGRTLKEQSPVIVGTLYRRHHEQVGFLMARQWRLPEELESVAGCHHDYRNNERFAKSATLAKLSHHLDLCLSTGRAEDFNGLLRSDEMEFLGLAQETRGQILTSARSVFEELQESREAA